MKCCEIRAGSSLASFSGSTSYVVLRLCESTHHFAGIALANHTQNVLDLRVQTHLLLLLHPPSILFLLLRDFVVLLSSRQDKAFKALSRTHFLVHFLYKLLLQTTDIAPPPPSTDVVARFRDSGMTHCSRG